MNEKNKQLWDEAIENIDDKYITETAETLKKHSGEQITLTEIIVEKPAEDKNAGLKRALRIAFSSAAGLAVVIGAGALLRYYDPLSENPQSGNISETSATSVSSVPEPILTTTANFLTSSPITTAVEDAETIKSADFQDFSVELLYGEAENAVLRTVVDGETVCEFNTGLSSHFYGATETCIKSYGFFEGEVVALFIPQLDDAVGGIYYETRLYICTADSIEPVKSMNNDIWSSSDNSGDEMFRTDSFIVRSEEPYLNIDTETGAFYTWVNLNAPKQSYKIDFTQKCAYECDLYPLDKDESLIDLEALETELNTEIFETVFYGQWKRDFAEGDKDILNFTYFGDNSFEEWSRLTGNIAETEDGWYMTGINGGEFTTMYVPKNDTSIMYSYGGYIQPLAKCAYGTVYKRYDNISDYRNLTLDEAGSLTARGIYKLEELTGYSIFNTPDTLTDTNGKIWKKWTHQGEYGTGKVFLNSYSDTKIIYSRLYCDNEYDIESYEEYTAAPAKYITITAEKKNGEWSITEVKDFADIPVDSDSSVIDMSALDFSFNTELFESVFYGKWTSATRSAVFNFTYYGDGSSFASDYTEEIAEDETGWYMAGIGGGMGQLSYIPKSDPETLYFYSDIGGNTPRNKYSAVYTLTDRSLEQINTAFNTDLGVMKAGSLTHRGVKKLASLTGYDIMSTPAEVTDSNGKLWKKWAHLGFYGEGQKYLKSASENKIEYSLLYCDGEFDSSALDPDEGDNPLRYLSFTAEKIGGEWTLTEIHEFDPQLETAEGMPTSYTEIVEKETAEANRVITEGNLGSLSSAVIAPEYHPVSDGHYFVHRRMGNDMALDLSYNEYYYYNGLSYTYLCNTSGSVYPSVYNDKLYCTENAVEQDTGENVILLKTYNADSSVWEKMAVIKDEAYSQYVDVDSVGVYNVITVTLAHQDEYYFIESKSPVEYPQFMEAEKDSFMWDEDKQGFTAVIDGEKVRYRPDSEELSDVIWALARENENVWNNAMISGKGQYYDESKWIRNDDGITLYALCDYDDFDDYIAHIYTKRYREYVMENSAVKYKGYGHYIYSNGGVRSANTLIGDITYEIISTSDETADIIFTAYKLDPITLESTDEVYETYTIEAAKMAEGWRLNGFYSPR